MKIEDILKKQGELYKNLTSNKTVEEYNEKLMNKMFKTLGDLIDQATLKGKIKIQDGGVLRLYDDKNQEIRLPLSYVYLAAPSEKYIGIFASGTTSDFFKVFNKDTSIFNFNPIKMKFVPESIETKEFYYWPLLLGFDQSHHGFSQWSAMLIEADFLDKNKTIKESDLLSKFLKVINEIPVMQDRGGPDKQFNLEEKIKCAKTYLEQG